MNKSFVAGLALGLMAVYASAEANVFSRVDLGKLPPVTSKTGVTYAADIKPLFEASCVRCHGQEKPKARLRLDSLEGVLKGSEDGKVLVPGDSAKSLIVVATAQLDEETAMPPKKRHNNGNPGQAEKKKAGNLPPPKPLTADEVGLLRAWIDQGAK